MNKKRVRQKRLAEKRRLETKKLEKLLAAFLPPPPPEINLTFYCDLSGLKPTFVVLDELDHLLARNTFPIMRDKARH